MTRETGPKCPNPLAIVLNSTCFQAMLSPPSIIMSLRKHPSDSACSARRREIEWEPQVFRERGRMNGVYKM